ncbi:pleckstrin homology domain-containing family B member 2-like isoform X2 [Otolemur garnettii]|uniref:pleckstrin homology domain-containing family B member 2-like isoform X2 n=1 Tax=Otolemur garnettii TaxID=30611 RepID=UPI000C7F5FD4|nr:pleckstrin homology domain-containing family B member 2-like isoform X2 [Otolemur garnettii]
MAFVKSGWLLQQSTILKRWKKNWFDLWLDGHLIYYDDQTRQSIEDKVHMPVDCINICMGHECQYIQPPEGKSKDYMLQIVCEDGKTISLCAESTDDCFRHMAMVHMVVHTHQELKLSMLQLGKHMLCPTSTYMQDFTDSTLPTKS